MFLLFLEITIVIVMARRLGMEASDKGFSYGLFIFLSIMLWIGSRIIGNLVGFFLLDGVWMTRLSGWLTGLLAYGIFYYLISRLEDKYNFDADDSWEKRNSADPKPKGPNSLKD